MAYFYSGMAVRILSIHLYILLGVIIVYILNRRFFIREVVKGREVML